MGIGNRVISAFLLSFLGMGFIDPASAYASEWNSHVLNEFTSDSIAQLVWLPSDPANPTTSGYRCTINYLRPSREEGTLQRGDGGIHCTNPDSEPFALPLSKDEITAHGTQFDHVKFKFQGLLQSVFSEKLRAAIRVSTTPNGRSTDPRVISGDICSPDGSFCHESMYLNDSADLAESSASLICVRNSARVKKGHERDDSESIGAWIDEELRSGALKVSTEYCLFTGP